MLTKRSSSQVTPAAGSRLKRLVGAGAHTVDRRTFLKRSGLVAGAGVLGAQLPNNLIGRANAADEKTFGKGETRRTVCTACSVGCSIDAVVENGVWTRQEPVFDSPLNMGGHCAKGASMREQGHGEHRLKTPMKLVNGKYQKISWEQAINEITDKMLQLRKESGPDSVYWVCSCKYSNEQAYLIRKFMALWGSNNCDHSARICHSTTVAGVSNTWGYGAMTNSYNDMQKTKCAMYIGSNAAEAHPVSMVHMLHGKETGAKLIVVDPRFTRTAAHADEYVRIRSGGDIAFLYGMLYHIFKNGWEDKKFISDRVWGMDKIQAEVAKWTPDKVEEVCGVPEAQVYKVAKMMADNRPSTVVWCMGQTQHSIGNAIVRASCLLQLALGNIGKVGGGTNIFRGHDNVQGVTDIGPGPDSLPGYMGITEGSWRHWCAVWGLDYDSVKARFPSKEMMEKSGITLSRWIDGVLLDKKDIDQNTNLRAVVYWGMAPNSQTRNKEMLEAVRKLDLIVTIDPHPTLMSAMAAKVRKDGVYLLPACTQFETTGSVTASNRSIQWREKVISPIYESQTDHAIAYALAKKLGFADDLVKNYKMVKPDANKMEEPEIESIHREMAKGTWTIGYSGYSPERIRKHMQNMHTFNATTLKAEGGPCDGEFFGLPWPCYGTPELGHPGSPNLYDTSVPVMEGGGCFRANFGVERDGQSLLAADGSYPKGSEIKTGYPEVTADMIKKLGWWGELTPEEQKAAEGKNWKTDLSGGLIRVAMKNHGLHPFGNARARAVVWNFPDPIPQHREPIYSPFPKLVEKYPTHNDMPKFWRLTTLYKTLQDQNKNIGEQFPLILTTGRLVEYEGGGDESRSNPWLAELQQESFVEISPKDANDRGIRDGEDVWLSTPTGARLKVKAMVTHRVGRGTSFMPYHFAGHWMGEDMLQYYPDGAAPIVRGEAVNTATTYGYDSVTMMQETKTTVCQIAKA